MSAHLEIFAAWYAWATMLDQDSARCECLDHEPSTFDRPALWLPVIVGMIASYFLLFAAADLRFGIQFASPIPYTAFVILGTFSPKKPNVVLTRHPTHTNSP